MLGDLLDLPLQAIDFLGEGQHLLHVSFRLLGIRIDRTRIYVYALPNLITNCGPIMSSFFETNRDRLCDAL